MLKPELTDKERAKNGKMPVILYLVEVMLAYNLSTNLFAYSSLAVSFDLSTPELAARYIFILISSMISAEMSIRSMINMSSAQKKSWRLVCRTMLIQIAFIMVNEFVLRFSFIRSVLPTELPIAGLCLVSLLIMFLPKIRRYYTPPLVEMPDIKHWTLYIFSIRDDRKYRYVFEY